MWKWTKVARVQVESLYASVYRALAEVCEWEGNKGFRERLRLVDTFVNLIAMAPPVIVQRWCGYCAAWGR